MRVIVIGVVALILTGCSTAVESEHNAPPPTSVVLDTTEPQNPQQKSLDFGRSKSLDAQGDIPGLLDQIHKEDAATHK